jgi:hypothetical protein
MEEEAQAAKEKAQIPPNATPDQLRDHLQKRLFAADQMMNAINWHAGQQGTLDNGPTVTPIVQSPKPGFGIRATGLPIQKQPPPTAEAVDNDPTSPTYGQRRMQGPTAPQATSGSVDVPPAAPGFSLPTTAKSVTGPSANFGGNVTGVDVQDAPLAVIPNKEVQNRFPGPSGPTTGMPPLFEEGKKACQGW